MIKSVFNNLLIPTILMLAMGSCEMKKDEPQAQSKKMIADLDNYPPTTLPNDTTKLWMSEGLIERDTVLIIGEGGPKNQLDYENNGRIYWEYLPNYKNYYSVSLHQSTTYNKEVFNYKKDFTLEMAEKEVDNSSEIMFRAIKYFKDRNKYVVVIGHSYSAFIIPHYLSTRRSLADRYIITGGRIDADTIQTKYQLKNINVQFTEDATTIELPNENEKPNPYRTERYFRIRKVKNLLKAAIGQHKYSEQLKDKDLSKMVFFYGSKDQNVGKLTAYEIDFLNSKNVQVIKTEEGHYDIWKRAVDAIESGEIVF